MLAGGARALFVAGKNLPHFFEEEAKGSQGGKFSYDLYHPVVRLGIGVGAVMSIAFPVRPFLYAAVALVPYSLLRLGSDWNWAGLLLTCSLPE